MPLTHRRQIELFFKLLKRHKTVYFTSIIRSRSASIILFPHAIFVVRIAIQSTNLLIM